LSSLFAKQWINLRLKISLSITNDGKRIVFIDLVTTMVLTQSTCEY